MATFYFLTGILWKSRMPPPGTFDLLGFTHYWSRSRKGKWVVKRKTAASRFTRAVRTIAQWCRTYRHRPIAEQHATLSQKLRGHYAYYGITGNSIALNRFREEVRRVWYKWLVRRKRGNRRSGRNSGGGNSPVPGIPLDLCPR